MNDNLSLIDPKLSNALQQWSDYYKKSAQDTMTLLKWMAPVKDAQQMSEQLTELLKSTDWQTVSRNWTDPALFWGTLQGAYSELAELQKASVEAGIKGAQQLLEVSQQASKTLSSVEPTPAQPQQTLAAYLQASLDVVKQYQEASNQQMEEISGLNSAGKVWLERTLTGQNAPDGE